MFKFYIHKYLIQHQLSDRTVNKGKKFKKKTDVFYIQLNLAYEREATCS